MENEKYLTVHFSTIGFLPGKPRIICQIPLENILK